MNDSPPPLLHASSASVCILTATAVILHFGWHQKFWMSVFVIVCRLEEPLFSILAYAKVAVSVELDCCIKRARFDS